MNRSRCRCGHPAGAHEHYRGGSNCGKCSCPFYMGARQTRGPLGTVVVAVANSLRARMQNGRGR